MTHQVDRVLDEIDNAMALLRQAMRGVPARRKAFKANHDRMAREVAKLTVALTDARSAIGGGNRS
jgi:hypothetical protein